jgi:diketogulonate reductase-like aldo/keto reductase
MKVQNAPLKTRSNGSSSTTWTSTLFISPTATSMEPGGRWEKLNADGTLKAIRVSNFYRDRIVDFLLHDKVTPAVCGRC